MSDFLLTQIINYGAPLLGVILLIGGLGAPLPCTLLVIAAGAFVHQGVLDWRITAPLSLVCVLLGDSLSYALGFYAHQKVLAHFGALPQWVQAEEAFQKWGALSIFSSRFLVTAIALPVNLISGTTRYPFQKFFLYDLLGETVWIFGYGGLGYAFGSQWEIVNEFLSNFGGVLLGLFCFGWGIKQAWNWKTKNARSI
ncbi:MAG: DedA family protein [Anaerolineales bacterium]|nr:DedA family protein [Anaerolineales bacterium]